MACESNESREPLPVIAEPPYRCVYVGKGPSFVHALDHLDFGDLATVNDTAAQIPGKTNRVAFCDGARFNEMIPQERTERIVIPPPVQKRDAASCTVSLLSWMRDGSLSRSCVTEAITNRVSTYFGVPGPSGVVALWLMGYKQIWLFGHDGGTGRAAEFETSNVDYQNRRDAIEFMVPLLAERGCDVKFWPEMPEMFDGPRPRYGGNGDDDCGPEFWPEDV